MVRNRYAFPSLVICFILAMLVVFTPAVHVAHAAALVLTVDRTSFGGSGACTNAANDCSLADAINVANGDGANTYTINFTIPTSDPGYDATSKLWTIKIGAADSLPSLLRSMNIVGSLDGASQTPQIVLEGLSSATNDQALQIITTGVTVQNLSIVNFLRGGILVQGPGNFTPRGDVKLQGLYLGFKPGSTVAAPNGGPAIEIITSNNNTIGGTLASERNYISGNSGIGIKLTSAYTNTLAQNYVGLIPNGNTSFTALGNGAAGIQVDNGGGNIIGGSDPLARNYIAANKGGGVVLNGPRTATSSVAGNFIGVNTDGATAVGNSGFGVQVRNGANGNTISGTLSAPAVISGNVADTVTPANNGVGVQITGVSTNNNVVRGVYIGTNANGDAAVPNAGGGVRVDNGNSTTIGVINGSAPNIISGNTGDGVLITSTNAVSTTIAGNLIGLNKAGSGKIANSDDGIEVASGARQVTIGGAAAAAGNTIAGNGGNGIRISNSGTVTTTVRFNIIGTSKLAAAFLDGLGNTLNGVLVEAGGPVQIRNSTIYSNTLSGVKVTGNTQRVDIRDTGFTGNGVGKTGDDAKAIALVGTTVGGGDATKPNHDIDPPNTVRVDQARQITGRVPISGASACTTCTIQFFGSNPATRDNQGRDQLAVTNYRITANGYFTATLPSVPRQLALTATDGQGNTSEFSTFLVTTTVAISRVGVKPPAPGPSETVQYTFRVTNTGSIDLADLAVTAKSSKNWTVDWQPKTLALRANPGGIGESKLVTITLTLPDGTDARVRFPTTDTTVVTVTSVLIPAATANASVATDVASKFVLRVTPTALSGQGVTTDPDNPVIIPYIHSLSNTGNLTGTVTLTATTDLFNPAVPANWKTTLDRTTITLPPGGKPVTVTVRVQLPYSGANAGEVAKTTLKVTQTAPTPVKTAFYTDTTTITASKRATITPSNVGDGAAAQVRIFLHTVTNFSNTPATFKLTGASSLGSAVTFRSNTAGVTLNADNTFTLGTSSSNNVFNFYVDVAVNPRALRGDTDTITISLANADGTIVGGVQDTINIVQGSILPRAYLPLITKR